MQSTGELWRVKWFLLSTTSIWKAFLACCQWQIPHEMHNKYHLNKTATHKLGFLRSSLFQKEDNGCHNGNSPCVCACDALGRKWESTQACWTCVMEPWELKSSCTCLHSAFTHRARWQRSPENWAFSHCLKNYCTMSAAIVNSICFSVFSRIKNLIFYLTTSISCY